MSKFSMCSCEGLEDRRLFATATFVIDRANSPVSISGTLNGTSITPSGTVNGFLTGSSTFSYTRRGIQFNDGVDGTIAIADSTGVAGQTFQFNTSGGPVSVVAPVFAFNSSRINVSKKKFTARRLDVSIVGGSLTSTAFTRDFSTTPFTLTVNYAVGHAKRTGTGLAAVKVTAPLDTSLTATATVAGITNTLVLNISGTLVGTSQVFVAGASLAPQAKTDHDTTRVADDVLG